MVLGGEQPSWAGEKGSAGGWRKGCGEERREQPRPSGLPSCGVPGLLPWSESPHSRTAVGAEAELVWPVRAHPPGPTAEGGREVGRWSQGAAEDT